MNKEDSPIAKIIEFEKMLNNYRQTSVTDLVINHCLVTNILNQNDITSNSERYKWLMDTLESILASARILKNKSIDDDCINIENIGNLINQRKKEANEAIKEISIRLYNNYSEHSWSSLR